MPHTPYASERVVLSAPMSFTGSAKRIWRHHHKAHALWARTLLATTLIVLIALAWIAVTAWYAVVVLFPPAWLFIGYRLVRRSQRRDKARTRQHRELLAVIAEEDR